MTKIILSLLTLTVGATALAAADIPQPMRRGYELYGAPQVKWVMPPNRAHLMDRRERVANITEEQFNQIIDDVMKYWQPIAQAKGVNLVAEKNWSDGTVNAYASQSGNTWRVAMFGGLARRPEVTPDGFALVVCHELGHHFAGYAFYGSRDWASSEGESDYFATNACAKMIWGKDFRGNERFRRIRNVPAPVQENCTAAWPNNANAQAWCVRAAAGGHSLATLLANLGNDPAPKFETPDTTVVSRTNTAHPRGQCRLDTYFAGALCTKTWDMNTIPGRNHPKGQNSQAAELESMKVSCYASEGFKIGMRPSCWFKALN
ncbi:MAG: M48 family metalloprotease [Bdellovibrionaceae bacterium]|nr:M48 family metalloprotease [Pseudobdellovibrionaceae bacterium]MBX3033498.1 M48 family metalloprotease [Pseudobdellovibrionaceae bacterium]